MQIIYVKCWNYQEVIFRWLKVFCSLPLLDDFEPSENQATKKWKWVFTPPPRETQADEHEVIVPAFLRPCPGWGGVGWDGGWGFKWLVHNPPIFLLGAAFSNYSVSCDVLLLIPYPKNVSCPISGMLFILKTVSLNPPGSIIAYMKGKKFSSFCQFVFFQPLWRCKA